MVMRKWPDYAQVGMAAKAVVGSIVGRGNAEEVVSSSPYLSSSLDRAHLQVLGTKTVFVLTGISVGSKVATLYCLATLAPITNPTHRQKLRPKTHHSRQDKPAATGDTSIQTNVLSLTPNQDYRLN